MLFFLQSLIEDQDLLFDPSEAAATAASVAKLEGVQKELAQVQAELAHVWEQRESLETAR